MPTTWKTTTIDTGALNALLAQMAEADAAKAARVKEGTPAYRKLLTKPGAFDHKCQDKEIKHFKDWSWQLVQYVNAIDTEYTVQHVFYSHGIAIGQVSLCNFLYSTKPSWF